MTVIKFLICTRDLRVLKNFEWKDPPHIPVAGDTIEHEDEPYLVIHRTISKNGIELYLRDIDKQEYRQHINSLM